MRTTSFIVITVLIIAIVGGLLWLRGDTIFSKETIETPVVTSAARPAPVPLAALVKSDRTYSCQQGKCTGLAVAQEGITDGEWWYYYEEKQEPSHQAPVTRHEYPRKKYLRRKNTQTGQVETIMESTPLTAPRDLFMSPNGQHVAFWLDNIAAPEEELTELWVYDVNDGGIRLLAEKLYRPDVRSPVLWNSQATFLWFIADTGEQSLPHDQLEALLVNVEVPGKHTGFPGVPWADISLDSGRAAVDISQRADQLAYTTTNFLGSPVLIVQGAVGKQRTTLRGEVQYVQWLEDDSLLYAVQDKDGFTFWRVREGVHRFIARRLGQLTSARSDSQGEHIVFATGARAKTQLSSLHIASGAVRDEGAVPSNDTPLEVVWVEQAHPQAAASPAVSGAVLDDAELAAFIEKNFADITDESGAEPLRLIMTDSPNVLFLDFRAAKGGEHRLQVKVQDAVNTEWSIRARYEPLNREWKKVQGGGLADPTPTRLYEWEESVGQWVLKENLE